MDHFAEGCSLQVTDFPVLPTFGERGQTVALLFYGKQLYVGLSDRNKTHTKARKEYDDGKVGFSIHAEFDALRQLPHDYSPRRCRMIVYRIKADGELGMAMPCVHCQKVLAHYRIKNRNIQYTDWTGKLRSMR